MKIHWRVWISWQNVDISVEEKKKSRRLFEYLDGDDEKGKENLAANASTIKKSSFSLSKTDMSPCCLSRKDSNQKGRALPLKGEKKREETLKEEEALSATETAEKETQASKDKNAEIAKNESVASTAITETKSLQSANFSLQLQRIEEEVTELTAKNVIRKFYVFSIRMKHANFKCRVSVKELDSFTWVKLATDGLAFFRERKDIQGFGLYVHEVIERDIDNVERITLFKSCGWKEFPNGSIAYVNDKGIIGTDIHNIRADSDLHFQIDEKLNAFESFKLFLQMQGICKNVENSQFLMVLVSKSVLSTLFEKAGFPDKNVTAILGTTNTLKTSTALVFSKIFNTKEMLSPEVTFSSTQAGIETYVAKYADAILLVDDFMPGGDRGKQAELNGKLELLCRLYGGSGCYV